MKNVLTLEDIKSIINEINEDIIGFYEDNSDGEGHLLVDGFENKNEFIKDYIKGIKNWID